MSDPDLSKLTGDGDTVELGDGRTLRLQIKPDDTDPFEMTEMWGKVAGLDTRRVGNAIRGVLRNDYGYYPRPDGFDGNAEKLCYGNGDCVWWQPHSEGPKRGTPEFDQERQHVKNLLEFGMCGFILELLEGKDAYRQPIVTKVASLWGIEPFPESDYKAEVIRDLWVELNV